MRGDTLASGGRSATFPAAPKISQEKWDAMWKKDEDDNKNLNQVTGQTNVK